MNSDQESFESTRQERLLATLRKDAVISSTKSCINCLYEEKEFEELLKKHPKTSSHSYTPEMIEVITSHQEGLLLDCGAGSRERAFDNVINAEIFPYPGTDIVVDVCELPFLDNSFDAIFSLAVLEHVKNPFLAMSEMKRVLKPGGILWVDVAFMQPFHGYPHHYFNMTMVGLKSLLGKDMKILSSKTPNYGSPIWSLTWIISKYCNNLPAESRERFLNMRLKDLANHASTHLNEDYVTQLDPQTQQDLAATVSIIATKEERSRIE